MNTENDDITHMIEHWRRGRKGRRSIEGKDMTGMSLRGLDLYNVIFFESRLGGANLSGSELNHSQFHSTSLLGTVMRDLQAVGIAICNSEIDRADFRGSMMDCSTIYADSASESSFRDASMRDAFVSMEVFGSDLRGVDARGMKLRLASAELRSIKSFVHDGMIIDDDEIVSVLTRDERATIMAARAAERPIARTGEPSRDDGDSEIMRRDTSVRDRLVTDAQRAAHDEIVEQLMKNRA